MGFTGTTGAVSMYTSYIALCTRAVATNAPLASDLDQISSTDAAAQGSIKLRVQGAYAAPSALGRGRVARCR